jgi:hypothetical protein
MKIDQAFELEPKVQAAAEELAGLISEHYPSTQFQLSRHPEEPGTVLLEAIVDVDDTDAVVDLIIDRMTELRTEAEVPLLVLPLRTPERVAKLLQDMQATKRVTVPAARP